MHLHIEPESNRYEKTTLFVGARAKEEKQKKISIVHMVKSVVHTLRAKGFSESQQTMKPTKILHAQESAHHELNIEVQKGKQGALKISINPEQIDDVQPSLAAEANLIVSSFRDIEDKNYDAKNVSLRSLKENFNKYISGPIIKNMGSLYARLKEMLERLHVINQKKGLDSENGPDNDEFTQLATELKKHITVFKTEAVTSQEITKIARGKAKDVWVTKDRPVHVYYTPVDSSSIINLKARELQQETITAKNIRNSFNQETAQLLSKNFSEEKVGRNKEEQERLARYLIEKYDSFIDLVEDMSTINEIVFLQELTHILPGHNDIRNKIKLINSLQEFFRKIKKNSGALEAFQNPIMGLALDMDEVKESEKIQGKYTVRASRAIDDLEKVLVSNNKLELFSFPKSMQFGYQFLHGMARLHQASYVHGDLKPENILVYGTKNNGVVSKVTDVRVADFGKTKRLSDDTITIYTGNPRFAAPEGVLSKSAEVFSSAIILIRFLEEELLIQQDMLLDPERVDPIPPYQDRRGIEKFLIKNYDCPQSEIKSLRGKVRVYGRVIAMSIGHHLGFYSKNEKAEKEVYAYIDRLVTLLVEKHPSNKISITKLGNLLKTMTSAEPKKRGNLTSTLEEYENIIKSLVF